MRNDFDYTIIEFINNAVRTVKAQPLILGATSSGAGGPPGGYVGFLPQTRVSYDQDELSISGFMEPGAFNSELGIVVSGSLLDNLNHIRYRLQQLESYSGGSGIGSQYFVDLLDTPDDYSGFSGYIVGVNSSEDGLEFIPNSGIPLDMDPDRVVITSSGGSMTTSDELLYDNASQAIYMGRSITGYLSALLGSGIKNVITKVSDDGVSIIDTLFDFSNTLTHGAGFQFFRALGTLSSPLAILKDTVLGFIRARGLHTDSGSLSDFSGTTGEVAFIATDNWSSSSHPTAIRFLTTGRNSTTRKISNFIGESGKKLSFLQLEGTKSDIYDSGSNYGLVKSIILHNTNVVDEVVSINLHDGTNEYEIYEITLEAYETLLLEFERGLPVNPSSKLTGNTTTADKVTCLISGAEFTTEIEEKVLAFGRMDDTNADIYDSGSTVGMPHLMIFHNTNTDVETPAVYLDDGTDEFRILKLSLSGDPKETVEISTKELGLVVDANSKLTGESTTADEVVYLIVGVER